MNRLHEFVVYGQRVCVKSDDEQSARKILVKELFPDTIDKEKSLNRVMRKDRLIDTGVGDNRIPKKQFDLIGELFANKT